MLVRPASHAGSWYSADPNRLTAQIAAHFAAAARPLLPGARVLIGPHAGFTYCGPRLGETYSVWDTSAVKRVFILGPSHHVYFRDAAMVSKYAYYDTPVGRLKVDQDVCAALTSRNSLFKYMSSSVDDEEHLFEMHAPFIAHRAKQEKVEVAIVPIMISGLSKKLRADVVAALLPYLGEPENTFVISLDFCHWGRRFGYTTYLPNNDLSKMGDFADFSHSHRKNPIYKSIETLDHTAMEIAAGGLVAKWDAYIDTTGNTICGQKPLAIVLSLIEHFRETGGEIAGDDVFEWLGYSQSNQAEHGNDSSVSYASGYVQLA